MKRPRPLFLLLLPLLLPLSGCFGTRMGFCRASIFTDATHFTWPLVMVAEPSLAALMRLLRLVLLRLR